jgi:RHS repeat-associated protein
MFRRDPTSSPDNSVELSTALMSDPPIAVYLYAGDQIVENVTTGYLYFQDSLGNTSHITDAAGNVLESYTYSAFGTPSFFSTNNTQLSTSAYGIKHLFQGQLWTQETGLNDYRNRVELPAMGVFLQPDPIGFKGDAANLYRFCNNNAVNRTDPMGLRDWEKVRQAMGNCNLIGFFQGEAQSLIFAAVAVAAQQIPVPDKLDSAARALGPRLVEMSRTNSDGSPKGTGWERGKTVGLVGGKPVEGDRTNVADSGTRFTGPQIISWTDPPSGAKQYVFVHAHTSTAHDKEHNTMTSPADRLGANQTHSAVYTVAADPHGGYITERYRPSAVRGDRIQGINGITELWSHGQWQPISN